MPLWILTEMAVNKSLPTYIHLPARRIAQTYGNLKIRSALIVSVAASGVAKGS